MKHHEYIVICGVNRSQIGRYISIVASIISAFLIYLFFKLIDLASYFGIDASIPPSILSLLGAGVIYTLLYYLFNSRLWNKKKFSRFIKVPDLSGRWHVKGETLSHEHYNWCGILTIVQSWDKVRIRLETEHSGSDSITASIIYDEGIGYQLLYNYRNDPKVGETSLNSHIGFAEFTFDEELQNASGEYFNGRNRNTFGKMEIRRM